MTNYIQTILSMIPVPHSTNMELELLFE